MCTLLGSPGAAVCAMRHMRACSKAHTAAWRDCQAASWDTWVTTRRLPDWDVCL